jgi:uncharacterized membrane protein
MNLYYLSLVLVIGSNVVYHICQKYTPENVNPMVAMVVTYATAMVISLIILFIYPPKTMNMVDSFKEVNWASFILGITIVGLEVGFLLVYRTGWNISLASLIANVILAVILIPIGLLLFKEQISIKNIIGIVLSVIGIIFVSQK